MRTFWAIALGAAVGGLSRHYLSASIYERFGAAFPWGTLLINVTGSFLLGFIIQFALATPSVSAELRLMLTSGFCGGYTTFSTFSYETAVLFEEGRYERAFTYAAASVLVALVAVFLGFMLARQVVAIREGV